MKIKHLFAGCLLASLVWAPARTWTSADGEKTFEGDLKTFDAATGKVTVLVNRTELVFSQDKLSDDDKTFLSEWEEEAKAEVKTEEPTEQKVTEMMTDRVLSRLGEKSFKRASLEKAPEYYLLYFSASW